MMFGWSDEGGLLIRWQNELHFGIARWTHSFMKSVIHSFIHLPIYQVLIVTYHVLVNNLQANSGLTTTQMNVSAGLSRQKGCIGLDE